MLNKCGQRSATIAIEAGSERLRRVINKNLTEANIIEAAQKMAESGLSGLKIYGIIGLPTETYEDIDEFINLCTKIKRNNKGFNITPAFSTFVPKAQTPFQYAQREETKSLEKKNEYIKKQFAKAGIKARTGSAKWDYIQTLLSRCGREITPYLTDVYKNGGTIGAFKNTYKEYIKNKLLPDINEIIIKGYSPESELPWDFIEYPKTKEFIKKEYQRLLGI